MKLTPVLIAVMIVLLGSFAAFGQQSGQDEPKEKPRYLYTWKDERGNLHVTDDIGNVPEKYRDQVKQEQQSPAGKKPDSPQPSRELSTPSTEEAAADEEERKAAWQQRYKDAKARLTDAERRYQSLQDERAALFQAWGSPAMAPIANRQRAEQIDKALPEVQKEIDRARREIDVVIPEEARKAGIPPGWLRE